MSNCLEITSAQNPRYKNWQKLLDGRGIKKQEQALVMGRSFIGEILARHPERVLAVIDSVSEHRSVRTSCADTRCRAGCFAASESRLAAVALRPGQADANILSVSEPRSVRTSCADTRCRAGCFAASESRLAAVALRPGQADANILSAATELALPSGTADIPLYLLPPDLFATLDIYGIKAPILLVSAPPLPVWDRTLPPGLTVFIPFQNPINLGTTIRSAAAFGARAVLLREAATPYLPKALRAAGPTVFQVPLAQGPSLAELAELDLPIFALSPKGSDIFQFTFPATLGLVAGLEGPGLDAYWSLEKRLSIPMRPDVESLNASVALSIVMALGSRQGCILP